VRLILREWQGVQKGTLILHPDDLKLISETLISNQMLDVISDSNQAQGSCKLSFGMSELHACFNSNIQALISALEDKNKKDFNQEKEVSYVN
jgi:flagellar biosynthesis/type III secretory pathway protein FliH